jgi:hypothetical protein
MHLFFGAQDGVKGAGRQTSGATDAPFLVDLRHFPDHLTFMPGWAPSSGESR